jgi:hypothetical protein
MNEKLKSIIKEYFDKVEEACQIIYKGLKINSKDELIELRISKPSYEFELNGKNQFYFHGRGCHFKNDYFDIDWDFGFDNKLSGIDPWKLTEYLKNNHKNYPEYFNYDKLRQELELAVEENELMIKYGLIYMT